MATYKIGKLKINTSDGLAFRYGDGEIRRLKLGKGRKGEEPVYNEEEYLDDEGYAGESAYESSGYAGRFAASGNRGYADDYQDDYADEYADDYQDDYADDDGYYDDEYAEDDGYYDEGDYADGDDGYYDDGQYDDRYSDEDADPYADDAYMDESPLMRYVDENDWVTFVLLFILPPLGIYLLWRRGRFDRPIRLAVSAASAIWFIILVVLIISAIFSGSSETTTNPKLVMTTPTPTVAVEATEDPEADAEADVNDEGIVAATKDPLAINPTATPVAMVNNGTVIGGATAQPGVPGASVSGNTASEDVVYTTGAGVYYHNSNTCANIGAGAQVSTVTLGVAIQQAKAACPLCYPNQKTYYATANGSYYHVDQNCSGMEDASVITKEAAVEKGKQPCPACIEKKVQTMSDNGLKFADSSTKDRSGITVYATAGGRYFHTNSTCSGMQGASSGTLLQGLMSGKEACPKCCASAGAMAYCTEGGKYYHNTSDCSGMENAYRVTVGEALVLGKKQCSTCWTKSMTISQGSSSSKDDASGVYVYGTPHGKYYHTNSSCSGMTGASRYTLKSMVVAGRPACPKCCSGADTTVYATEHGTYYHSFATCSGMSGAGKGTLSQALAYGKKKCPECWSSSSSSSGTATGDSGATSKTKVYATKSGKYYHTKKNCNGMTGASYISLSTAVDAGKRACSTCTASAGKRVYSSSSGKYYHATKYCNGAKSGSSRTLESALLKNQTACPICVKGSSSSKKSSSETEQSKNTEKLVSSETFRSGTSGIKVYAVADGKHYHTNSSCSGMTDASRITLETALNYGKTACSKCASSANTKVYAVRGGKYYHTSKSCAGDGAVSGTRGEALAYGFDPCPYCVTKVKDKEEGQETVKETYKSGTSKIKVWGTVNGKYYHTSKTCAGSGASHVTLETALNYSKKPCPSCAGSAGKTVYSKSGDKYYHTSKTCAGSGYKAGDFAQALALGKKECPNCIGGSESYEISDIKYSAPADTTVYVDLDSDMLYYHKSSYCHDAGLHGGTGGPLGLALDMKYKACPFCAPPTSVKG